MRDPRDHKLQVDQETGFGLPSAVVQLGIRLPGRRIDREDRRAAKGPLKRQAIAERHLAARLGVRRGQLVVTDLGREVLEPYGNTSTAEW